jgi:phosphatidylglycerol lysyltransferase
MVSKQTRWGLASASILTGFVGIVNLVSALTPALVERRGFLHEFVPFAARSGSHIAAALTGFFLLTLSANLFRRKRIAWYLVVSFLIISILSHLIKGLDYEESLLAGVLLIQLLMIRKTFTARSDLPSIAQGIRILVGAIVFNLAYGTLGFFLLDEHYSINFSLWEAIVQTLAMFFTADNAGLTPTTRFGRFFADSIYIIGAITLLYALWMLLRPVLLRKGASSTERQNAQMIVEQYGHSSLARFTLLPDKFYYFSPSRQTVIAYVAKGRGAIALGDPIGPLSDRHEAIVGFQDFCERNDWQPAFYQTLPDELDLYRNLGFRCLKIGEEGIVDLRNFTLSGKTNQNLRNAQNKLKKQGYIVEFEEPPISPTRLQELREISDEWLHLMHGSEKQFSLGWFDESYLRTCEIAVVRSPIGEGVAFANIVTEYQQNEITIDLMRRRQAIEHGVMDFLFIELFQHFQTKGYAGFNLGLSALSGVGESPTSPRLEKGMAYLYEHLNQFYNFKGLHNFKQKFHPRWESRYLIYPSLAALPDVVVALIRADSGDRLLDYFKPGS